MTDTEHRTTFFGIPVTGDITRGDEPKDQRPDEEFAELLRAVLARPEIAAVRWEQYTPYFNDGEPCTFSANGVAVKFVQSEKPPLPEAEQKARDLEAEAARLRGAEVTDDDEDDDEDDESGWLDEYKYTVGEGHYPNYRRVPNPELPYPTEAIEPIAALHAAVEGGEFYNLLLRQFGDHARVTVTRENIKVEEYSHD